MSQTGKVTEQERDDAYARQDAVHLIEHFAYRWEHVQQDREPEDRTELDPEAVRQVLEHLLRNRKIYSHEEGMSVRYAHRRCWVPYEYGDTTVRCAALIGHPGDHVPPHPGCTGWRPRYGIEAR